MKRFKCHCSLLVAILVLGCCKDRTNHAVVPEPTTVAKLRQEWNAQFVNRQSKADYSRASGSVSALLDQAWPALSNADRNAIIDFCGACGGGGDDDGFRYELHSILIQTVARGRDPDALRRTLSVADMDVIWYTPVEYAIARSEGCAAGLKGIDALFDAASTDCTEAKGHVEAMIRRSLAGVFPEAKTLDLATLRQWFEAHKDEIQVDPAYPDALRQWSGVPDPVPPMLIRK